MTSLDIPRPTLTPEQRAAREARLAQRAAREAALAAEDALRPPDGFPPLPLRPMKRNRELARRRCMRLANEVLVHGRAVSDVAEEEGITPGRLREIFDAHGVPPILQKGARVMPLLAIGGGPARQLDRVAAELGMQPAELAELFLVVGFRNYGKIARRILAKRLMMAHSARAQAP